MANDRTRREDVDYSGADPGRQKDIDPGRQKDMDDDRIPSDDIRGVDEGEDDEFEDTEDVEDEEESDEF